MKRTAVRLAVGGLATLALLLPGVAPGWAAEPDGVASGVVRLDGKPRAGIKVCDLFDETDCAISGPDGFYSVTPKVERRNLGSFTVDSQCLHVHGSDTYEDLAWSPRTGLFCLVGVDVAPGGHVTRDIDVHSYPIARGRLINGAGKGISGGLIRSGNERPKSVTDKNGRFAVRMGPYGYDEEFLVFEAKGYEMSSARWAPHGDLGPIVLAKAGSPVDYSVSGRVLDAKGRPYHGVKVCLVEGPCLGKVHSNGYFYGLLRRDVAEYGSSVFTLQAPGSSSKVKRAWEVFHPQASFAVKRTFRLKTSRRIVVAKPKIIGQAKVGQQLKVKAGAWLPKPVTLRCVWYVGSKQVQIGCSSLQVKSAYRGKEITVKVIGSRTGYATKKATSRATVQVYR